MSFFESLKATLSRRPIAYLLLILAMLFVALLVFDAGVAVGTRRAFNIRPHGNMMYERQPMFGVGGVGVPLPHGFIPGNHGAVGTISAISLPTFDMTTRDGAIQHVRITDDTRIEGMDRPLSPDNLSTGQSIVVFAAPGEMSTSSETLDAHLIRVLP
ncbi:MAG TPA: hypothetical protein VG984_02435 [Candidatus Paceibacterota bacterium]|nr:hypothetical protein [Candidatus Paceibacterota bacterium]